MFTEQQLKIAKAHPAMPTRIVGYRAWLQLRTFSALQNHSNPYGEMMRCLAYASEADFYDGKLTNPSLVVACQRELAKYFTEMDFSVMDSTRNHRLTRWDIPALCRALSLSKSGDSHLIMSVLSRFIEEMRKNNPFRLYGINPGCGIYTYVMMLKALGLPWKDVAMNGFGNQFLQSGLTRILKEGYSPEGVQNGDGNGNGYGNGDGYGW